MVVKSKGNPLLSGRSGLVKYYNLGRLIWPLAVVTRRMFFSAFCWCLIFVPGWECRAKKRPVSTMGIMGMLEVFEELVIE